MSSTRTAPVASTASPSTFILRLPKAELHLHLEGSVEAATLAEISQRYDDKLTVEEAEALYRYEDFSGFMTAFKAVVQRLRSPEDYETITYELMKRLRNENVLHAEVYVSVGVCLWRKQDFGAIFEGLERGRERGQRDFGVSLLWIFDAVRHFGPEATRQVVEKAAQLQDRSVVGIGIGGDERQAGPELFLDSYRYAAEKGLRLTAHAGETTGPESIWGALNLKVERIGHGLSAWQDRELMAELVERQIPVEICLTSNLETNCCQHIEDHPLKKYFDSGVMVTLNTDDPAMFHTSLNREYALAQQVFGFSDEQLREVARNGFEASFLPAEKKIECLSRLDASAFHN
jgi:adenosine deaminase/aminodeoxyfutalosine deaminase